MYKNMFMSLLGIFLIGASQAMSQPAAEEVENAAQALGGGILSQKGFLCAVLALCFGTFIAILSARLVQNGKQVDEITRLMALILIVTSVLFLVATGYSVQQISPAIGLLGAIAGYLLGRADRFEGTRTSADLPREEK